MKTILLFILLAAFSTAYANEYDPNATLNKILAAEEAERAKAEAKRAIKLSKAKANLAKLKVKLPEAKIINNCRENIKACEALAERGRPIAQYAIGASVFPRRKSRPER